MGVPRSTNARVKQSSRDSHASQLAYMVCGVHAEVTVSVRFKTQPLSHPGCN